ncbi:MAG: carboxypeptidase-like regulatory domain-containing protein [Acidobacteriota bacterium]|nr:carboxypeptidase-like regulatory domain-containing protein [Acidobacteriota bacterium]
MIPLYLWSVDLEPDQKEPRRSVNLGNLQMTWGASVSGWVTADAEPVPTAAGQEAATATVRLTPVAQGTTAAGSGLAAKAHKVQAQPNGFFQLQGVEAGEYELSATFPGLSTARVPSLLVQTREETRLPSALVVPKPTRLTVQVEPEADPWGRPWQLRLLRAHPSAHYLETVAEATSSAQGWTSTALEPGTYQLRVFDETGATWWNHPVEVRGGEQEEWIEIPVIEVVGAVRRGGDPVTGELIFGTTQGKERLNFPLDEDGRFEGYLPREGTWPLELRPPGGRGVRTLEPVEVEVPQGELIAELDIELPDTLLYGEVVDEDGEALANAHLTLIGLRPEQKRREALDQADDEGRFEIEGLTPGDVLIRAAHENGKSPWRQISLQEGLDPGSLRLVVEREAEISGRVVAQGRGLAGALVLAQPDPHQGLSASQRRAVSAAGGGFRLQVPARPLSLLVWAPGHPLRLLRHSPSTESTEPLELDLSTASGELVLAPAAALSGDLEWNQLTLLHRGAQVSFLVLVRDLQLPLDRELRLSIPQAQPGEYALCATGPATCARGVLAPGGQLLLELALPEQAAAQHSTISSPTLNASSQELR